MNVSIPENLKNRVKSARIARGWSQDELARRSGLSRSGISAIEIDRLVPSAIAALALAKAFSCRVEDLFSLGSPVVPHGVWAASPATSPCRYWHADVGGRRLHYPADLCGETVLPHDGVFDGKSLCPAPQAEAEQTLVMACCDPAVGLLAHELARRAQIRLLVIPRSSRQALDLLRDGLVHAAGLHLSRAGEDDNACAVRDSIASGTYSLLRVAQWEEGLAIAPGRQLRTVRSALRARLRWVGRESGSGAHQCLLEVRGDRPTPRHHASSHRGVAEAIRSGWADAGVCLRMVSDQAGLDFLTIREEAYDLCFAADSTHDPRIQALIEVVRSASYRKLLGELPGYSATSAGAIRTLTAPDN
ncbi:MAG TPA: substrate-binding domain-containing protein [Pirellulales bacterium]|jgi:molybdate-binding protein/DNA-binding XRE family transcriptional regulator